ncbi:MAG: RsmD family RNA methyltransferase [Bacteroidales bacterium]|nr:RsmD family RNA methyltransferase [Candidatus Cacconaster merdequi]
MRIIGGSLRGRTILPPAGYKARPTTDFAKEGLFNTLLNEFDFTEISVLDLFGGTGSISFEFASRGCGDIVCVEMAPANASFISRTAASLGVHGVKVVHNNVFDFIDICSREFDIVFADPPYAIEGLDTIPDKVLGKGIVRDGGYLILEHPGDYCFQSHRCFVKEKKYGNVHFSYFKTSPKAGESIDSAR